MITRLFKESNERLNKLIIDVDEKSVNDVKEYLNKFGYLFKLEKSEYLRLLRFKINVDDAIEKFDLLERLRYKKFGVHLIT
jgi:thermostable 8-oxoguanine DNA glycosylase